MAMAVNPTDRTVLKERSEVEDDLANKARSHGRSRNGAIDRREGGAE